MLCNSLGKLYINRGVASYFRNSVGKSFNRNDFVVIHSTKMTSPLVGSILKNEKK